jgi:hypothetical protein
VKKRDVCMVSELGCFSKSLFRLVREAWKSALYTAGFILCGLGFALLTVLYWVTASMFVLASLSMERKSSIH